MSGYLHCIDMTGCKPIDNVLRRVIAAGDSYHHTDGWSDRGEGEALPPPPTTGGEGAG